MRLLPYRAVRKPLRAERYAHALRDAIRAAHELQLALSELRECVPGRTADPDEQAALEAATGIQWPLHMCVATMESALVPASEGR